MPWGQLSSIQLIRRKQSSMKQLGRRGRHSRHHRRRLIRVCNTLYQHTPLHCLCSHSRFAPPAAHRPGSELTLLAGHQLLLTETAGRHRFLQHGDGTASMPKRFHNRLFDLLLRHHADPEFWLLPAAPPPPAGQPLSRAQMLVLNERALEKCVWVGGCVCVWGGRVTGLDGARSRSAAPALPARLPPATAVAPVIAHVVSGVPPWTQCVVLTTGGLKQCATAAVEEPLHNDVAMRRDQITVCAHAVGHFKPVQQHSPARLQGPWTERAAANSQTSYLAGSKDGIKPHAKRSKGWINSPPRLQIRRHGHDVGA